VVRKDHISLRRAHLCLRFPQVNLHKRNQMLHLLLGTKAEAWLLNKLATQSATSHRFRYVSQWHSDGDKILATMLQFKSSKREHIKEKHCNEQIITRNHTKPKGVKTSSIPSKAVILSPGLLLFLDAILAVVKSSSGPLVLASVCLSEWTSTHV